MKTTNILNIFFIILAALCLLACNSIDKGRESDPKFQVLFLNGKGQVDTSYYHYNFVNHKENNYGTMMYINDSTCVPAERIVKITRLE